MIPVARRQRAAAAGPVHARPEPPRRRPEGQGFAAEGFHGAQRPVVERSPRHEQHHRLPRVLGNRREEEPVVDGVGTVSQTLKGFLSRQIA